MMKVIGVDFDDVIFDFNDGLRQWHNAAYGPPYKMDEITDYPLEKLWGCDRAEAVRRVHEFYLSPEHMDLKPIPRAVESLNFLKQHRGCMLVVGTSRPKTIRDITHALLEEHFPGVFADVFFLGNYHGSGINVTKAEICKWYEMDAFVDDHIEHVHVIAQEGIPTFLYDRPWNRRILQKGVTRVYDWHDIVRHVA